MKKAKTTFKSAGIIALCLITFFSFSGINAQSSNTSQQGKIVKGIVDSEEGPIYGANILLKGTQIGITTEKDGTFTFPRALKTNDILVFSYLGFETMEIKIQDATPDFLRVMLTSDFIEITGAVAVDKPYKSKRKN